MNEVDKVTPAQAGAIVRQDFVGGTELQVSAEQQVAVLAAREEAEVKALFALAKRFPRNMDDVRTSLLKDCARPRFAEKAMYALPRGGQTIEGLSVRFAEDVLRTMGNMMCSATITEDSAMTRTYRVRVLDLEHLAFDAQDVQVAKTIERKADRQGNPPAGYEVVGQRLNKSGEKLFIVKATEDDLLARMNAMVSKMRRNKILELVPFDLKDECIERIRATKEAEGKKAWEERGKDPDAFWRKLADSFAAKGVKPSELEEWLGHELRQSTEPEVQQLREIIVAIGTGETTWRQEVELRMADREKGRERPPEQKPEGSRPTPPQPEVASGGKPKEQTEEFAVWVMARMRQAKTLAELKTAAVLAPKAPKQFQDAISNTYAMEKSRIEGGK